MLFIPHFQLIKKHKALVIAGVLCFWALLGMLVYATELIASYYFGAAFMDQIEQKQYLLRWMVWLLLTPAIILFALKINIENCHLVVFISLHLLLGTLLLSLEFCIELLILKPLAEQYYHRPVLVRELMVPFLNKYFGYVINYFLIVGMVNLYVYMQSLYSTKQSLLETELQNKNLKYDLALAQIQSLKKQIQPHFLFNAHQSLLSLILQNENKKAADMLSKLSDLLRITLQKQDSEFITVEEEVEMIKLYLSLQQIRYDHRMECTFDISPEAWHLKIPFFTLQPLAENAVKFGVEQSDKPCTIGVRIYIHDHMLNLAISNTTSHNRTHPVAGFGIGLQNVSARLQQHYQDAATLELYTDQVNTIAQISIPLYAS